MKSSNLSRLANGAIRNKNRNSYTVNPIITFSFDLKAYRSQLRLIGAAPTMNPRSNQNHEMRKIALHIRIAHEDALAVADVHSANCFVLMQTVS